MNRGGCCVFEQLENVPQGTNEFERSVVSRGLCTDMMSK